jgi:hypothetical protein
MRPEPHTIPWTFPGSRAGVSAEILYRHSPRRSATLILVAFLVHSLLPRLSLSFRGSFTKPAVVVAGHVCAVCAVRFARKDMLLDAGMV